jgi:hypothetical protein
MTLMTDLSSFATQSEQTGHQLAGTIGRLGRE